MLQIRFPLKLRSAGPDPLAVFKGREGKKAGTVKRGDSVVDGDGFPPMSALTAVTEYTLYRAKSCTSVFHQASSYLSVRTLSVGCIV